MNRIAKKILNDPRRVVEDMIDGLVLANDGRVARACLHYLYRACCAPDCANQGARTPAWMQAVEPRPEQRPSEVWSFQMSDKQRRVAQSGAQPEGPGCFAPRRRSPAWMQVVEPRRERRPSQSLM